MVASSSSNGSPSNGSSAVRAAQLLHYRSTHLAVGDPLAPPLVTASAFHLPGEEAVDTAPYAYGRFASPTLDAVETQIALLEDAPTIAFPSGMAAICASLFAVVKAGDKVILPSDGYHATRILASRFLSGLGVKVIECATSALGEMSFEGVALVFAETPSNPLLDVCDLRETAMRAHGAGARLVVDNTTMTAYLQRPLDLGADIVVAADTKAPGGHSDVLFGHAATRDPALEAAIRDWRKFSGAIPGPFEAWLVHRGMETLEVRLARMGETAGAIAPRLAAHRTIRMVRYPGLPDDPSHEIAREQMTGFGFMISFEMESAEAANALMRNCPFLAQSTSFGGVHSSAERRIRWGDAVPEGFVRLSVGIEPTEILWAALEEALDDIAK